MGLLALTSCKSPEKNEIENKSNREVWEERFKRHEPLKRQDLFKIHRVSYYEKDYLFDLKKIHNAEIKHYEICDYSKECE
jgi:hypothetical protein